MESRSVPGLVVPDIYKIHKEARLLQTKSEGSNVNGPSSPRNMNMYQALVSALESHRPDSPYPGTSSGDMNEGISFGSRLGTQSDLIGSRSESEYDGTSLSRNESQSEKSVVPRMRSISDIVRETEDAGDGEEDRQIRVGMDTPSILDTLSLQDSGRIHNPSTSSQPGSIDSVSV